MRLPSQKKSKWNLLMIPTLQVGKNQDSARYLEGLYRTGNSSERPNKHHQNNLFKYMPYFILRKIPLPYPRY